MEKNLKNTSPAVPESAADELTRLREEEKVGFFTSLSPDLRGEVLWFTDRSSRIYLLNRLDEDLLASSLSGMPPDRAAHCLRLIPPKRRRTVLSLLPSAPGDAVRKLLAYPPDTAGARMNPEVTPFPADSTVGETIKKIRETGSLVRVFHCYVVDEKGRVIRRY